jgi:hypothetical protein
MSQVPVLGEEAEQSANSDSSDVVHLDAQISDLRSWQRMKLCGNIRTANLRSRKMARNLRGQTSKPFDTSMHEAEHVTGNLILVV